MIGWINNIIARLSSWWRGDIKVTRGLGDTLPSAIPPGRLMHMVDNGENWSVGFNCPCGCGDIIELLLLPDVDPHWTLTVDNINRPTLQPSVWKRTGCKSHFWLRQGRVIWAEARPGKR